LKIKLLVVARETILVGFWGKGEGLKGKGKISLFPLTFNLFPLTFNPFPVGELVEPLTFSPNQILSSKCTKRVVLARERVFSYPFTLFPLPFSRLLQEVY